ncbi:hypothetical protein MKQ70_27040 [Chitinophaga sedimenti]|uniref:hypothetical protein n=1 Tax=Chitinophaga sedimenti TaxID=2033606 RepID=UPI0020037A84|nr:hypothetical protein [Chitinophaga sedimenti]MCK7558456.1 hypothetical protein [Chitinophaga sedimenti]
MKRLSTILLLLPFTLQAQETSLNNLLTPSQPGFVILDKSPASIEKPTSPKTLGISVLRLLEENGGGLDFSPYWFGNHPNLTFEKYMNNRFPVLQTLNVSVAAAAGDTSSYMSAGLRTQLFRYYRASELGEIARIKADIVAALSDDPDNIDLDKIKELKNELSELTSKTTVNIELAAAMAGFSPDNKFGNLGNNRYGAWLNMAYRPIAKAPLHLMGVVRYTKAIDPLGVGRDSSLFDYGLAMSYQQAKFDVQLEFVNRNDVQNGGIRIDWRWWGIIWWRIILWW